MHKNALQRMDLIHKISIIPENEITEVSAFVDFILFRSQIQPPKPRNLKGIWKDKGFQKIPNLDEALKNVKKELSDSILKRKL